MPENDGDEDEQKRLRMPRPPRLVPSGPLRARGEAFAHEEQGRQRNLQHQTDFSPMTKPSELESTIERERARRLELQTNQRILDEREQRNAIRRVKERFNEFYKEEREQASRERQAIDERRDAGRVRGVFNRLSGRAGQDDGRLQQLDAEEQRRYEHCEQALSPLREQHRQQNQTRDEHLQHEMTEFDRTANQARERGHFPEHERLTRDPRGRGDGGRGGLGIE